MTDRVQLNLRLDGKRELLDTIKKVATAEGLSVNAWVVKTLEQATANPTPKSESTIQVSTIPDIEPMLDKKLDEMLDKKLAVKFAAIEERLQKIEGLSDSPQLLQPDAGVTENELQNELGNLKADNETLKADYATLLQSSTAVANSLREEVRKLRSQLEAERGPLEELEAELSELQQNFAPAAAFSQKFISGAPTILSKLRTRRKKSKADLVDVETILEILQS